jgi:hypothetical protein
LAFAAREVRARIPDLRDPADIGAMQLSEVMEF